MLIINTLNMIRIIYSLNWLI